MYEFTEELAKKIAEKIIRLQLEDVEYLTVVEVTEDYIDAESQGISYDDTEALCRRVDNLVGSAEITIKFKENNAS